MTGQGAVTSSRTGRCLRTCFWPARRCVQKQGMATSTDDWERQRALSNAVGHEYPDPAAITDILNGIHAATPEILGVVERLRAAATDVLPDG
jgi:hypothetical protein